MDCSEYLKQIQPLIDGELGSAEEERLLDHLAMCPGCSEWEQGERSCWERVRDCLDSETIPAGTRARALAALDTAERRASRKWWATILLPLATAAAVLFSVGWWNGPSDHDHGGAPHFFAGFIEDLGRTAKDRGVPILSKAALKNAKLDIRSLEEARPLLNDLFGERSPLVQELLTNRGDGAILGTTQYQGTPVTSLLLAEDRGALGIFRLTRKQAHLAHLKPYEDGETREVKIEECPSCRVVAVTRGDTVYLLIAPRDDHHLDRLVRTIKKKR